MTNPFGPALGLKTPQLKQRSKNDSSKFSNVVWFHDSMIRLDLECALLKYSYQLSQLIMHKSALYYMSIKYPFGEVLPFGVTKLQQQKVSILLFEGMQVAHLNMLQVLD